MVTASEETDLKISKYPKEFWDRHYFSTRPISVGGRIPEDSTEWKELKKLLKEYGIPICNEGFYSMIIDILVLSKAVFAFARENGFDPLETRARAVEEIALQFQKVSSKKEFAQVNVERNELLSGILTELKGKVEKQLEDISK